MLKVQNICMQSLVLVIQGQAHVHRVQAQTQAQVYGLPYWSVMLVSLYQ